MQAHLILSDGTTFSGIHFGYETDTTWEVVFTTGMVGYPETLTDPSYAWQILTLTYPLQGNYGIPDFDVVDEHGLKTFFESDAIHLKALIVNQYSPDYAHQSADMSLGAFLKEQKTVGIMWIDTRALTKKLREEGTMMWAIVTGDLPPSTPTMPATIDDQDLVWQVSHDDVCVYGEGDVTLCVVDMWIKNNMIRNFLSHGLKVVRVPHNYPFMDGTLSFDALFLSNGPGDPEMNTTIIAEVKKALDGDIPIFGICLWNQLLALAAWAKTYKLPYGHRGQNQPCKDLVSGACIITSQNHGYAVDESTLPSDVDVWFTNINDGTNEWLRFVNKHVRSVQFHPESAPGPHDAGYLFEEFVASIVHRLWK